MALFRWTSIQRYLGFGTTMSNFEKRERDIIRQARVRDIQRRDLGRGNREFAKLDKPLGLLFAAILVISFSILMLPVAIPVYLRLKKKHLIGRDIFRITDYRLCLNKLMTFSVFVILSIVCAMAIYIVVYNVVGVVEDQLFYLIALVWLVSTLILGFLFARLLAACLIGVVFDKNDSSISIPHANISGIFGGNAYFETIELNKLRVFDAKDENSLVIMGDFGSRVIEFSTATKRDECLLILENWQMIS